MMDGMSQRRLCDFLVGRGSKSRASEARGAGGEAGKVRSGLVFPQPTPGRRNKGRREENAQCSRRLDQYA